MRLLALGQGTCETVQDLRSVVSQFRPPMNIFLSHELATWVLHNSKIIRHQSLACVRACVLVCEKVQKVYVDIQKCKSGPQSTAIGDAQYQSLVVKRVLARHCDTARSCLNGTQRLRCPSWGRCRLAFREVGLIAHAFASNSLDALDDAGTRPLPPPPPWTRDTSQESVCKLEQTR